MPSEVIIVFCPQTRLMLDANKKRNIKKADGTEKEYGCLLVYLTCLFPSGQLLDTE